MAKIMFQPICSLAGIFKPICSRADWTSQSVVWEFVWHILAELIKPHYRLAKNQRLAVTYTNHIYKYYIYLNHNIKQNIYKVCYVLVEN